MSPDIPRGILLPTPAGGHSDGQTRPRIYGLGSFGRERCASCGLPLQRCYLVGSLCRVCRGEPARAGQKVG